MLNPFDFSDFGAGWKPMRSYSDPRGVGLQIDDIFGDDSAS